MTETVHLNEKEVKSQLGEMVRESAEKTLNELPDAEADEITQAHRYEPNGRRSRYASRTLPQETGKKAGTVDIKVPKLRKLPFETGIIERRKHREESVEEALIEMYLSGVSVRRAEDISEALWGARVLPGTISNLNR